MTPAPANGESGGTPSAGRPLGRIATIAAFAVAALLLAAWVPHYLTWPLWSDADCRLMQARAWDAGQAAPYRDVVTFNFPGEVYLYWVLGKAFGWERAPLVIRVFDAAFLVAFGAALALWSRRLFGRALPGAIAFVALLWAYLGFDVLDTGQRDWFGPVLAIESVLVLETTRSRAARAFSALLFAAGFVIRPHVVLFVPAAVAAAFEPRDGTAAPAPRRAAGEWLAFLAGGVALGFLPLAAGGLVPDLLRGLAIAAPGGAYHEHDHRTVATVAAALWDEVSRHKTAFFPCVSVGLALLLRSAFLPVARTWAVAAAGGLLYAPLHPHQYHYLEIPSRLLQVVQVGIVAGILLHSKAWRPAARAAAGAAVFWLALPGTPRRWPGIPDFCSFADSAAALKTLTRGEAPATAPPGVRGHFAPSPSGRYEWGDYCRVLDHLRREIPRSTRVASMFRNWCFPALNGMADRGPVFPTDQGIVWTWQIAPEYEHACAVALERTPDSVVVWVPGEDPVSWGGPLPELEAAVRRLYVPDAQFGAIEVWRRR
jgi:hypothetical protein